MIEQALECDGQIFARRIVDGEVVQARRAGGRRRSVLADSFFLSISTLFLNSMGIVFVRQDHLDAGCGSVKVLMLKMNDAI